LEAVVAVLDELAALVAEGEDSYRTSPDRQAHVRYLWVVAGSRLKNYCQVAGIGRAKGDFAGAIGMRHVLAYKLPEDIRNDAVWRSSADDLPNLRQAVQETLRALAE
jgi:uncharacterized protein with HEPN domain